LLNVFNNKNILIIDCKSPFGYMFNILNKNWYFYPNTCQTVTLDES